MSKEVDAITKIIKEELAKKKILLEEPQPQQHTKVGTPNAMAKRNHTSIYDDDDGNDTPPHVQTKSSMSNKDYKPGFTLYHGIVNSAFLEGKSLNGEAGIMIQKLTKNTLDQLASNTESDGDVFQSSQIAPKLLLSIIQKVFLLTLNHVGQLADEEAAEKKIYSIAATE